MLGLAAGVGLPDLAAVMKPYLPHMVATTLFLAAFFPPHFPKPSTNNTKIQSIYQEFILEKMLWPTPT